MNKELTDIQDLKSAFVSHCKTLGCSIDYITMCQIMFANIENALKEKEQKKFIELTNKNIITLDNIVAITKDWIDETAFHYRLIITYKNSQEINLGYKTESDRLADYTLLKEVLL